MREISAGGVVYRSSGSGVEIQLIRDRYGKITVPKGKMESGETIEQTALREISEETGIEGKIKGMLEMIAYQYQNPRHGKTDKEVHYFLVEAVGGTLKAQVEEISGVEWFTPADAWKRQKESGYGNNDSVLRKALNLLGIEVIEYGV